MDVTQIINAIAMATPGFLLAICGRYSGQAYVASLFGDDTAERSGRLSFNPAAHFDLVGTLIFPLFGIVIGGIPFGWGQQIPKDTRRFTKMKQGMFWTGFAGPLANILIGFVSLVLYAFVAQLVSNAFELKMQILMVLDMAMKINLIFAVFHLLPFPPLDGAQMVSVFLNYEQARKFEELERFTLVFFLILWMTNIFSYIAMPVLLTAYLLRNFIAGLL